MLDLSVVASIFFTGPELSEKAQACGTACRYPSLFIVGCACVQIFKEPTLNGFMSLGRAAWSEARQVLQRILSKDEVRGHTYSEGRGKCRVCSHTGRAEG